MITAEFSYTPEDIKKYRLFLIFKTKRIIPVATAFSILVLLFVWALFCLCTVGYHLYYFLILVFDALYLTIFFLRFFSAPKKAFEMNRKRFAAMKQVVFDDVGVAIHAHSDEFHEDSAEKYSAFYKAIETNEYFFLFINKQQAYIIPKRGFTQGTPQELSMLLENKMYGKFFRK